MLKATDRSMTLLDRSDPDPVEVVNRHGKSGVVLVCEHAGRCVPFVLGGLGIAPEELDRHIGHDIGAEGVARRLSHTLDAVLVLQRYSRLVVDCNRPFEAEDCVPEASDGTAIPANRNLPEADRARRFDEIHRPFHDKVKALLDQRAIEDRRAALVTIHSFTPRFANRDRPWQLGVCFNRDRSLAEKLMLAFQRANPEIVAAFNEPYAVDDLSDYTIPVHGERRAIPHALIEIRNDQILDEAGQDNWARLIANIFMSAPLSKEGFHGA
jgi:predicted N-formylglutamate amidohydrolase